MSSDFVDYKLLLERVERDEVLVSIKKVYITNWKISETFGKLRTAFWFSLPHLPIIVYGIYLIYTGEYLYLFAVPIIYFIMLLANYQVNCFSLLLICFFCIGTILVDIFFETNTKWISIISILSFVLAVMSLYIEVSRVIEKAISSKELFRKLYDDKILEIYEK